PAKEALGGAAGTGDFSLLGYSDSLSVVAGESIGIMVSGYGAVDAELIRLDGVGGDSQPVRDLGSFSGGRQRTSIGSYVHVPQPVPLGDGRTMSISCWAYPTMPKRGRPQALVANRGWP